MVFVLCFAVRLHDSLCFCDIVIFVLCNLTSLPMRECYVEKDILSPDTFHQIESISSSAGHEKVI